MTRLAVLPIALVAIVFAGGTLPLMAQPAPETPAAPGSPPPASPPPSTSPSPATAPTPTPPARPRGTVHSPSPTRAGRPTPAQIRAAREECRQQANAQSLRGSARANHLRSCFAVKMPTVVKRTACRKQGKAKGLSQASLRSYVRGCMSGRT